jgi:hypothetical protein
MSAWLYFSVLLHCGTTVFSAYPPYYQVTIQPSRQMSHVANLHNMFAKATFYNISDETTSYNMSAETTCNKMSTKATYRQRRKSLLLDIY